MMIKAVYLRNINNFQQSQLARMNLQDLGLYIVKTMADKMGGRIWVESEKGKGAEFKVALKAKS